MRVRYQFSKGVWESGLLEIKGGGRGGGGSKIKGGDGERVCESESSLWRVTGGDLLLVFIIQD